MELCIFAGAWQAPVSLEGRGFCFRKNRPVGKAYITPLTSVGTVQAVAGVLAPGCRGQEKLDMGKPFVRQIEDARSGN